MSDIPPIPGAVPSSPQPQSESQRVRLMEIPDLTPEKTRISFDLKMIFVLAGLLATGAFAAGGSFMQLTGKLSGLEGQMTNVSTKSDLAAMRQELTRELGRALRQRLSKAIVKCPAPKRGEAWVECKIALSVDDD